MWDQTQTMTCFVGITLFRCQSTRPRFFAHLSAPWWTRPHFWPQESSTEIDRHDVSRPNIIIYKMTTELLKIHMIIKSHLNLLWMKTQTMIVIMQMEMIAHLIGLHQFSLPSTSSRSLWESIGMTTNPCTEMLQQHWEWQGTICTRYITCNFRRLILQTQELKHSLDTDTTI